jgi:cell shape-determining protein MreD
MGDPAMTWTQPTLLLLTAFLGVWAETQFLLFRNVLGAPLHSLPSLVVVTALQSSTRMTALLSVLGGLWFDSFSDNPLGVTILPLFAVGMGIRSFEALLLRDLPYAQVLLGTAAGVLVPLLTLAILLTLGLNPALGWATYWQLAVMGASGGLITPLLVHVFVRVDRALNYPAMVESSFRPDREIKRGRL